VALNEGRGGLRAFDADREQAVEALEAALVQDRLAKTAFEAHLVRALASRTFAELVLQPLGAGDHSADNPGLPGGMPTRR
jgi:DUF1707 SHOCT-like domain